MQLHSANDQMTAHVNMAFSRPQNYDSLQQAVTEDPDVTMVCEADTMMVCDPMLVPK
jgi:hypothetical protein